MIAATKKIELDQPEALRRDDAEEIDPERAGHAGVKRSQRKAHQLVAQELYAEQLRRDIAIANGDEGAPDTRAQEIARPPHGQRGDRHGDPVDRARRHECAAEEARRLDRQSARAAGDRSPIEEDRLQNEGRGDCGQREIETFHTQARNAEHRPDGRGHKAAGRNGQPERQREMIRQIGRSVGADAHEGRMAETDKTGKSRENHQSHRRDDVDRDEAGEELPVIRGNEGKQDQREGERSKPRALHVCFEDRLVGCVGLFRRADPHLKASRYHACRRGRKV